MAVTAVQKHPEDNVAVLLHAATAGDEVVVTGASADEKHPEAVVARDAVPAGHKLAISDVPPGAPVVKYGYAIGRATQAIAAGEYVHVHNVQSYTAAATSSVASPSAQPRPSASSDVTNGSTIRKSSYRVVYAKDLRRFAQEVAVLAGASHQAARDMADSMVEADLRGVHTHGIRRLPLYAGRLKRGSVDGNSSPVVTREGSLVFVDGRNGVGHHVARRACDEIIEQVQQSHLACAAVRNSNHLGFAGYYSSYLARHGLVGVVTSNGTPCVAPPGGTRAFFSNNPFAISAPTSEGFVELDVAMSVTSRARVTQAYQNGIPIPSDWALDSDGKPTSDPEAALKGSMQPFGGDRGFALLFGLELLAGILPGGANADLVAPKDASDRPEGTSHWILGIALDAVETRDSFVERLEAMIDRMRRSPRVEGATSVRYPGERRWRLRSQRLERGIPLPTGTTDALATLAQDFQVQPLAIQE